MTGIASRVLGAFGRRRGRFRTLPLADGWTQGRDMPAPEGRSFQSLWAERQKKKGGFHHGGTESTEKTR